MLLVVSIAQLFGQGLSPVLALVLLVGPLSTCAETGSLPATHNHTLPNGLSTHFFQDYNSLVLMLPLKGGKSQNHESLHSP